jgi:hypothetical protein
LTLTASRGAGRHSGPKNADASARESRATDYVWSVEDVVGLLKNRSLKMATIRFKRDGAHHFWQLAAVAIAAASLTLSIEHDPTPWRHLGEQLGGVALVLYCAGLALRKYRARKISN